MLLMLLTRLVVLSLVVHPGDYLALTNPVCSPLIFSNDAGVPSRHRAYSLWETPTGTMPWRLVRCFDTFFRHNPDWELTVYSNTLPRDYFAAVFGGLSISVEKYSVPNLVRQLSADESLNASFPVDKFFDRIQSHPFRHVWKSDWMRLAIGYLYGGSYLDTDMIALRSWTNLPTFVTCSTTGGELFAHNFMSNRRPGSPFMAACLEEAAKLMDSKAALNYNSFGSLLLTPVLRKQAATQHCLPQCHVIGLFKYTEAVKYVKEVGSLTIEDMKIVQPLGQHLFSSFTRSYTFSPGTFYSRLFEANCLRMCNQSITWAAYPGPQHPPLGGIRN